MKLLDELTPEKLEKAARALCRMRGASWWNNSQEVLLTYQEDEIDEAKSILLARYEEMAALFEAMK